MGVIKSAVRVPDPKPPGLNLALDGTEAMRSARAQFFINWFHYCQRHSGNPVVRSELEATISVLESLSELEDRRG